MYFQAQVEEITLSSGILSLFARKLIAITQTHISEFVTKPLELASSSLIPESKLQLRNEHSQGIQQRAAHKLSPPMLMKINSYISIEYGQVAL